MKTNPRPQLSVRQQFVASDFVRAALRRLIVVTLAWPVAALAQSATGGIPAKIQAAAKELKVSKLEVSIATIKSIDVQGTRLEYEFSDSPRIGSMLTNKLSFTLDKPDPLLTVPRDTKKVRIYWGPSPEDDGMVVSIQKIQ